jgi:hypothetical protein
VKANCADTSLQALDDLLTVIGTEAVLKLRGKGGCVVKKVFDHEDLLKVFWFFQVPITQVFVRELS